MGKLERSESVHKKPAACLSRPILGAEYHDREHAGFQIGVEGETRVADRLICIFVVLWMANCDVR